MVTVIFLDFAADIEWKPSEKCMAKMPMEPPRCNEKLVENDDIYYYLRYE